METEEGCISEREKDVNDIEVLKDELARTRKEHDETRSSFQSLLQLNNTEKSELKMRICELESNTESLVQKKANQMDKRCDHYRAQIAALNVEFVNLVKQFESKRKFSKKHIISDRLKVISDLLQERNEIISSLEDALERMTIDKDRLTRERDFLQRRVIILESAVVVNEEKDMTETIVDASCCSCCNSEMKQTQDSLLSPMDNSNLLIPSPLSIKSSDHCHSGDHPQYTPNDQKNQVCSPCNPDFDITDKDIPMNIPVPSHADLESNPILNANIQLDDRNCSNRAQISIEHPEVLVSKLPSLEDDTPGASCENKCEDIPKQHELPALDSQSPTPSDSELRNRSPSCVLPGPASSGKTWTLLGQLSNLLHELHPSYSVSPPPSSPIDLDSTLLSAFQALQELRSTTHKPPPHISFAHPQAMLSLPSTTQASLHVSPSPSQDHMTVISLDNNTGCGGHNTGDLVGTATDTSTEDTRNWVHTTNDDMNTLRKAISTITRDQGDITSKTAKRLTNTLLKDVSLLQQEKGELVTRMRILERNRNVLENSIASLQARLRVYEQSSKHE